MIDIIHLLPDSVANQIAAGEVVQRPASIVKELVENSIDAGAKNIYVVVTDGGKTNVQVVDDGKGMSETDARMSFERHATSKIQQASDLFTLTTMGFRGEALASIAAVAQVELKTRRAEDELGTYVQIAGSKFLGQEPVACPVGSNFSVKNLFFNVPARRKFLKSNQTELTNVVADFERIVLVHPDIAFTLYNNGAEMYNLPASSVRGRILDVFGKKLNTDLLPVEVETSLVNISGYVAKPESSKKKGTHQYFFVNGRYMRHPYFHSAVMRAYDNLIPAGEHVSYFIYFSVDPSAIDVNVHPTKTEIKFDNEQPIWQVLSAAVKETVGKFSGVPLIDFDVEGRPDIPAFGSVTTIPQQPRPITTNYNPFADTPSAGGYKRTTVPANWDKLYNIGSQDGGQSVNAHAENEAALAAGNTEPSTLNLWNDKDELIEVQSKVFDSEMPKFQYKGRYIIYPDTEGIIAVDQHRAHVRVLYERYMNSLSGHPHPTQKVLFPDIVQFTRAESVILEHSLDDLLNLGFDLTNLGGGSYSVSGVPADIQGINVDDLLHEIVANLQENPLAARSDAWQTIALSMAEASAACYGQVLSLIEMDQLLSDLLATSAPALTPDGKVIYAVIDSKAIDKLFK
ncbi:MAG: DNA mismatch repair endonuclease MutL [Bacteroidaceae bacterium]|nr:DNA mismatch repair endonuclease MutL [Bacteroidaceae bacterium]